MTPTELDLARQLVAHPRWRWMPGMRDACMDRLCVGHDKDGLPQFLDGRPEVDDWDWRPSLAPYSAHPDLSCPATQGCLWAMLREAHDFINAEWIEENRGVTVMLFYSPPRGTENYGPAPFGKALALALLAALGDP
jgi:hypothetical protein